MKMRNILLGASLSVIALSASAADVRLYGVLDYGFTVSRQTGDGGSTQYNVSMKSGGRNASRFGLKGSEDLANNLKVSFILESQFLGDTGTLQTNNRLWEREASLAISGDFGKLTFGRLGYMKGSVSSVALLNAYRVNPFGGIQDQYITGFKPYTTGTTWSVDNSIVYATSKFSGFTGYLQYSNATDGQEGRTNNAKNRYFAGAIRYENGPVFAQILLDTTNLGNDEVVSDRTHKDPFSIGIQTTYDFGFLKTFIMAEYFKESYLNNCGELKPVKQNYDGFGGTIVLQWPLAGGKAKIGMGYMSAERSNQTNTTDKYDVSRWGASIGYDYELTKRTHIYTDAGFVKQTIDTLPKSENKKGYEYILGVVHYF